MTRSLIQGFSSSEYTIGLRDFANALSDFGVQFEEGDVKRLFKYFDKKDSGRVDLADLLDELRGQEMSFERFDVIRKAYTKLDSSNTNSPPNSVSLDDIARVYNVSANPDVISGRLSAEQAYN